MSFFLCSSDPAGAVAAAREALEWFDEQPPGKAGCLVASRRTHALRPGDPGKPVRLALTLASAADVELAANDPAVALRFTSEAEQICAKIFEQHRDEMAFPTIRRSRRGWLESASQK